MSPRTLFRPYAALFAKPGTVAFSLAGWLARLPMSTLGLGTVLLVSSETGSYGLAGALSGTLALSFALASPQWARRMDRRGQGPVLRLAVVANLVSGLAFLAAVVAGTPHWLWFALAALTGATSPNIGALIRARWAASLDPVRRQTAFAFESVVDEVVFVIGPPFATVLATLIAPPAGFLAGLLIGVVGGLWLAGLRSTEPPLPAPEPTGPIGRPGLLSVTVVVVVVVFIAIGTVFGAIDVVVVGFTRQEGAPVMAGATLAAFACGSLVAGLLYGVVRLPGTLTSRFIGCSVLFGLAIQLLLTVGSLSILIPVAFVSGLSIAPVLVAGTSLVESRVASRALTEALSWTATGLTVGVTAGSAIAGVAVDAWGAHRAFAVPALGAGLAGILAVGCAPLLRTAAVRASSLVPPVPAAAEPPVTR